MPPPKRLKTDNSPALIAISKVPPEIKKSGEQGVTQPAIVKSNNQPDTQVSAKAPLSQQLLPGANNTQLKGPDTNITTTVAVAAAAPAMTPPQKLLSTAPTVM